MNTARPELVGVETRTTGSGQRRFAIQAAWASLSRPFALGLRHKNGAVRRSTQAVAVAFIVSPLLGLRHRHPGEARYFPFRDPVGNRLEAPKGRNAKAQGNEAVKKP